MGDIKNFLCGILIGISNAIPGVSGGTMAVILNMYDKILEAVSISNWRRHKRFLAVLSLGMVVGIVGLKGYNSSQRKSSDDFGILLHRLDHRQSTVNFLPL